MSLVEEPRIAFLAMRQLDSFRVRARSQVDETSNASAIVYWTSDIDVATVPTDNAQA